jgi:hypothetical protein
VRRGHNARLDRLWAAYEATESEAVDERSMLRFYAATYPLVLDAMARAGVDPASSPAMREVEAKLAGFVDTPELPRAEYEAAETEEGELIDGMDPREWLIAEMDERGRLYAESGTTPNFQLMPFIELLAWATPPEPEAG